MVKLTKDGVRKTRTLTLCGITGFISSLCGIYHLASLPINGRPYWLQENGTHAIWYDDKNMNWKLGSESNRGTSISILFGDHGTADTALPQEVAPWKFLVHYVSLSTYEIHVDVIDEGKKVLKIF